MEEDATTLAMEGQLIAGKYRVERVLGAGGMGIVVAAHHTGLNTKVAIKFLLPEMLLNKEVVARFAREAQAAVKITSEHVARVQDVGTLDTGAPYIVMEFLEGADLAAWLDERGVLPVEQAVEFILQACVALAEAHGLGIVHRDLKPANLFCIRRPDGQLSIKVLDFGISKVTEAPGTGQAGMSVTTTAAVMGSPLYMSPEQMESTKSADAQSDIWALGIILYELLTKQVPFEGQAAMEVAIRVATHTPEPPSKHRPELPTGLDEVILKCMEKDRHKRYMNVAELAIALAEFGPRSARASVDRIRGIIHTSGLSVSDLSMPPSSHAPSIAVPVSVTGEPVGSTLPEPPPTKAPRRSAFVPAAVGVVLAVVVTAMALTVANLSRHAASTLSQQQAPAVEPPATPSPAPSSVPAAPEPASEASAAPVASPAVESRKPPVAAAASGPRRPAASTTALVRAPAAPPPSATAAPPPPRPTSPLTMQPM